MSEELSHLSHEHKLNKIDSFLKQSLAETEAQTRYSTKKSGYCSPREALRRNKYFSEDYLNKEFDIFLNLCSDNYLDYIYSKFTNFNSGGRWSTHGNSGLFSCSTDISEMQMDNLAYNITENMLIANELKLGGRKNSDQIIKYSFMHRELEKKGFIDRGSKFILLFLGDKEEQFDQKKEVDSEVEFCTKKERHHLLRKEITDGAYAMEIYSTTWHDLIFTNTEYLKLLKDDAQVERKLIAGFNHSLQEKAYLQK